MSMNLGSDFVFRPETQSSLQTTTDDNAQKPLSVKEEVMPLGPLKGLLGKWQGTGMNTIWRPRKPTPDAQEDFFLELNLTEETLVFEEVPGNIPNRGFLQDDINMRGLHYLQTITDVNVTPKAAIHFEPGLWLTIPATTDPAVPASIARLASIPHGTTILAQGVSRDATQGPPNLQPVDITPFTIGDPNDRIAPFKQFMTLSEPTPFRTPPNLLSGITQEMVNDPNILLSQVVNDQTILSTLTFEISTTPQPVIGGGTANTAFLQGNPNPNAVGAQVDAIFWIERVKGGPGEEDFDQLQYTQTVLLNFNGLSWPHTSVSTLRRV